MLKDEFEKRKADYLAIIENLEKDYGIMQKDDTQNEKTLKEKNQKLESECLELRQSKIELEGIQNTLAVKICNKTGRFQDLRELLKVLFSEIKQVKYSHVTGATDIPLQNRPDMRLVIFEPLRYRGSEIGLKRFFIYACRRYYSLTNFLENPKEGPF